MGEQTDEDPTDVLAPQKQAMYDGVTEALKAALPIARELAEAGTVDCLVTFPPNANVNAVRKLYDEDLDGLRQMTAHVMAGILGSHRHVRSIKIAVPGREPFGVDGLPPA